ncbi:MAG: hypothetical protein ACP5VE_15565 [Chthonomonadales bacterium]
MCGICGIIHKDRRAHAEEYIRAMNARIRHRGPDDEGYGICAQAALRRIPLGGQYAIIARKKQ